jgi:hypothetical protein
MIRATAVIAISRGASSEKECGCKQDCKRAEGEIDLCEGSCLFHGRYRFLVCFY